MRININITEFVKDLYTANGCANVIMATLSLLTLQLLLYLPEIKDFRMGLIGKGYREISCSPNKNTILL